MLLTDKAVSGLWHAGTTKRNSTVSAKQRILSIAQVSGNGPSSRFSGVQDPGVPLIDGRVADGPDLSVKVNGLNLPNPFVIGSGPPGTNYQVMKKAFDEGWGGVICKTLSLDAGKVSVRCSPHTADMVCYKWPMLSCAAA